MCLLHDNARSHTTRKTIDLLNSFGWDILNHPAHSPDQMTFFFILLKEHMGGKRFSTDEEVKEVKEVSCVNGQGRCGGRNV